MTQQLAEVHFPQREQRTAHLESDRQAQATLAALIARDAPETRAYRVRWSQGETQVLDLGAGPPLLLLHGGLSSAIEWVPILSTLARNRRVLALDRATFGPLLLAVERELWGAGKDARINDWSDAPAAARN